MSGDRKRIALAAGEALKGWEAELIRGLARCPEAEVIGWFGHANEAQRRARRSPSTTIADDPLLAPVPSESALRGLPRIPLHEARTAGIVLYLGGSTPAAGETAHGQRHWLLRHADGAPASRFAPGAREAVLDEPWGRIQFVDASRDTLLNECCFPVDDAAGDGPAAIARLIARWPCEQLRNERLIGSAREVAAPAPTAPVRVPSGLGRLLLQLRRWLSGAQTASLDASGAWNIGVLYQPVQVLLREDGSRNVRWLPSPSKGRSRMEPFGYFDSAGELNALYRKGDDDGGGGHIARVRPKADNILKRSRTMLDGAEDAAYPFVLMIDGAPHAVIADHARGEVRLRPVNPDNAGLGEGKVILHAQLHSPTLFQHEGRWWLLGTQTPWPEACLHAYHAPAPQGPFTPHARSPLKCHAEHARPAGTPFVHDGHLYRPTLDASDPSHPAVWINRVELLTPDAFHETPVRRLEGFPATAYGQGVRTVSAIGDITLVDGLLSPVLEGAKANARRGGQRAKQRKA